MAADTPWVRHARYGEGRVEAWRRGGRAAVVRFTDHPTPMEVPRRALQLVAAPEADPPAAPVPPAQAPAAASRTVEPRPAGTPANDVPRPSHTVPQDVRSRQGGPAPPATRPRVAPGPALIGSHDASRAALTLEAMRLGVVPETGLEAYTVGRGAEIERVEADLRAVRAHGGAVRAIVGDYGTGKTHMLEVVQQLALERGYLTAFATLDPEETAPSHPKRVYRALMRTLRYPDRPTEERAGLAPLLTAAAQSPDALAAFGVVPPLRGATIDERLAAGAHLYLSPAIAYARTLLAEDVPQRIRGVSADDGQKYVESARDLLLDWLEGHPTVSNQTIDQLLKRLPGGHPRIYSLADYRPWARIYGYILSGLAALARAVGYEGLVILLDEAEFYALLSRENRGFAAHLFKAWTYAAVGGSEATSSLPFDAGELAMGGMGVLKRLPGRSCAAPGLYLVYAMTPAEDGLDALAGALPPNVSHDLEALGTEEYMALSRCVCDFYASARQDWTLPQAVVAPLGKVLSGLVASQVVANPRQAMKLIIEFLDVVYFRPERVPAMIRDLQQTLTA